MALATVLYQTPWGFESLLELTNGDDNWISFVDLDWHLFGADGNDTINSAGGDDVIAGGAGHDTIYGGAGFDNLFGDSGNDTLIGEGGIDQLFGGSGADVLASHFRQTNWTLGIESISDAAFDHGGFMDGGTGNDTLFVDVFLDGSLSIDGGADNDTIDFDCDLNVWLNGIPTTLPWNALDLEAGSGVTAIGGNLTVARVENILGGMYKDKFSGNDFANVLRGRANNDMLEGRGGADVLDGGTGHDIAHYSTASSAVTVDLSLATQAATRVNGTTIVSNGDAAGDMLISIEEVRGSAFADVLSGRTVTGSTANERFVGNGGNDTIEGRTGADHIDGGTGFDFASYASSNGGVNVVLARLGFAGSAQNYHAAGDTLVSIEGLIGSAYGDTLVGNDSANQLLGNGGNDSLSGLGGADIIRGGAGIDTIWGGAGRDTMEGGAGSDTFKFAITDSNGTYAQRDVILDFQKDVTLPNVTIVGDTIELSGIDANTTSGYSGNQAFSFIGNKSFTVAGQLRVSNAVDASGVTYNLVQAETNGDGIADLQISVYTTGLLSLTSADFLL